MSRKDFEPFIRQWLSDKSSQEGRKVTNHGNNQLFVENGDLYSYGHHYLLCRTREKVAFVNAARHSMTTSTQQGITNRLLNKFNFTVHKFIRTPDVTGVLRYMDRRLEDFLLGTLKVSGGNVIPASQAIILGRTNPMAIITELFDPESIKYCLDASGEKDLHELALKISLKERELLTDLVDVLDIIKDPEDTPKTSAGHIIKFMMGKAQKIPGHPIKKAVTQFVYDMETYGPEIAAMNLSSLDNGKTIQSSLNA